MLHALSPDAVAAIAGYIVGSVLTLVAVAIGRNKRG